MNLVFPIPKPSSKVDQTQSLLLRWAALFFLFYSLSITFAPAARLHSWQVNYPWLHWVGFFGWMVTFIIADRVTRKLIPDRDGYLLPIAGLLSGWGLLSIWRLSPIYGIRQTIWLFICLGILYFGLRIPGALALIRRYKYIWLTGGLALTALTFLFGTYPGGYGPKLWLGCCGVYFQPSEPLKLLLIIYLAAYLSDAILTRLSLTQLLTPTLVLVGVGALLLIAQRDLGTVTLFFFIYATVLYVATGLKRVVAISLVFIVIAAIGAYFGFDVVRLRVDSWLNPWADPTGRSYQIVQSLISIASGGILGRGPGLGSPGVVPVAQSDFIYSAIFEETGYLGAVGIIVLFGLLFVRGLRVAVFAPDPYQRYLAAGISIYLAAQSLLIIGGNLRMFPLTGVTLPLVSYGGSSLLTSFLSILLLLLISHHPDDEPALLPNPNPYLYLGASILSGFAVAALLGGWWSFVRSDNLISRTDNPRRIINDRYVKRGTILDRKDIALDITLGSPGNLVRNTTYPPLSPILGYTNGQYGQAGLEASLDPYLRGALGYPSSYLWINQLLYGQNPPGLDVRLTIDHGLQEMTDDALGNHQGAGVLINAANGEILAMSSHPSFDPNHLVEQWSTLVQDPTSPLFDRAALGQYPSGTTVSPFLAAGLFQEGLDLPAPQSLNYTLNGTSIPCDGSVPNSPMRSQVLAAGCPGYLVNIGDALGEARLIKLYQDLGFFQAPVIHLPSQSQSIPQKIVDYASASIGREAATVSPLQMVIAAATLTSGGIKPAPRLVISVHIPKQGWIVLPAEDDRVQVFTSEAAIKTTTLLASGSNTTWEATGRAPNGEGKAVSWFIGGTLPTWNGIPMALAMVIEQDNVPLVKSIGEQILSSGMHFDEK